MEIYAHTKEDCPVEQWEPLYGENGHAAKVAWVMESYRVPFVAGSLSESSRMLRTLALYHDMGKASAAFQQYLRTPGKGKSVNHKTAAARWLWDETNPVSIALAYALEGHHSGLPCGTELSGNGFLNADVSEAVAALPAELRDKPHFGVAALPLPLFRQEKADVLYNFSLVIRMLHSCLVDADWSATEAFMDPQEAARRRSIRYDSIEALAGRLEKYLEAREQGSTGYINALRKEIHHACHRAAEAAPGMFRLNVPTGGGKTLSSLSFALEHARRQGLDRVIYVIPFTGIIEQTAQEFRAVLGNDNVVEHHSNISVDKDSVRNRISTETWDAPLIVTTSVQFFESLYAAKNRRCRKLHNIAHAVIIFDEAQSLPSSLLAPCLAAMKGLHRVCGCSLVLCTATQPHLTNHEGFGIGWEEEQIRSLLGGGMERRLAREMKRVEVHELGTLEQGALVGHFLNREEESALFIVNLTRQAQELYQDLQDAQVQGLYHLSARMCPAHRLEVLNEVRARLKSGLPTVLVSTRVVEAGVDVSFPIVYRDRCGLDSLAQSAGRCNRHGEAPIGRVFSYAAAEDDYALPSSFVDLKDGVNARADALAALPEHDPFSPEVIKEYFSHFYNRRRGTHWDVPGVMQMVSSPTSLEFPEMDKAFQMIPGGQISVLVPYGKRAGALRQRLLEANRLKLMPTREDFKELQQLSVSVYSTEWEKTDKDCVHREAGIYMATESWYDSDKGLLREAPEMIYVC